MSNVGTTHKGAYKNNNLNTQDSRVRRHEVTLELRKSKREDHLFKRRNITADGEEIRSPLKDCNGQTNIVDMLDALNSSNDARKLFGMQAARKMLCVERNPPIDLMINNGIVPIFIRFLKNFDLPKLQFEAAWGLTNIASGTTEQTRCIIEHNAVPHLIVLLQSKSLSIAEQAAWALANIAGDCAFARDTVLYHNVIDGILSLINPNTPVSLLRNIVWLMSNLCRNRNPSPQFEKIKRLLPVLLQFLGHTDIDVLSDACWALSHITEDENYEQIEAVVQLGAVPHLVRLLGSKESEVIMPALRTIGNIVTGTDQQTDAVLAADALPRLGLLLDHSKNNIIKEAAWTISNIAAGNEMQIQAVLDSGVFVQIRKILEKGDFRAQKESAWAVTHILNAGTREQIDVLINKYQVLKPFLDLLNGQDARTILVVLTGIMHLFELADAMGSTESLCLLVEELGGLDKLESLQNHENEDIYNKSYALVAKYFSPDDGMEADLAPQAIDGSLAFNAAEPKAPNGGYMF